MVIIENVSKTYGKQVVLEPTSLKVRPQAITVLIGPSGCGKSTLLRVIMGLIQPDTGKVLFELPAAETQRSRTDRNVPDGAGAGSPDLVGKSPIETVELNRSNVEALRHSIGYVIQDGGLFPHLTAEQNVTLLARFLHSAEEMICDRVKELSELVRLPSEMLQRYPAQLSGGQRQRVGLMRALMLDPNLLLLDEPLGALDPITRYELQSELKEIFARLHKTVVLVTHDMGEAAYFGDEIVLMRAGKVVQQGTVEDLLERPAEKYVSDFIRAQRSPLPALSEG